MNEDQLLHYDPLKIENISMFALVHRFFAKLWVVRQGPMSQNSTWKWATTNNSWVWLNGPQQESDWECGFYVMRFKTSYCKWMFTNWSDNIQVRVCLDVGRSICDCSPFYNVT
jgi:hypothetical protein